MLELCKTPQFISKVTALLPKVRMSQNLIGFPQTMKVREKESVVMPTKLRFPATVYQ